MKRWIKCIVGGILVVCFIFAFPILWWFAFQKKEEGIYSDLQAHCLCGQHSYYITRDNYPVAYIIGHHYYSETFELTKDKPSTYRLIDWDESNVGTLDLERNRMVLNWKNEVSVIPRIWNPWQIWLEKWKARNEPLRWDTYKEKRELLKKNGA